MPKKLIRILGCLWEKIFRRKELNRLTVVEHLLGKEVKLLTTGESINLDEHERNMILSALEYVPFREAVELPETKAMIRKIWRKLREKIQLSIKKEDGPQPVKKDDETTLEVRVAGPGIGGEEEIVPIPDKPNPKMIDYQYRTRKEEAKK